jgi:riboflavin biosynthesis pyrimidine reductase
VDLAVALRGLADRGLARVHTEGGPTLLRELLAAGLVDELCLTVAPVLVGGVGHRPVVGREGAPPLAAPVRLELLHLLHGGDPLLGRWHVP